MVPIDETGLEGHGAACFKIFNLPAVERVDWNSMETHDILPKKSIIYTG